MKTDNRGPMRRCYIGEMIVALWVLATAPLAVHATDALDREVRFDIAPAPLAQALIEFSRQSGIQVATADSDIAGIRSDGVTGERSVREALRTLLHGTALEFTAVGVNTLVIRAAPPAADVPSQATSQTPSQAAAEALDEVVVTGEQPGPGLWKVWSAEHVLWILGEPPTPLPAKLVWRSKQVEEVARSAQEVIVDGRIAFDSRLGGRPLLPMDYYDLRELEWGKKLKDVIPENLSARFTSLEDAFAANHDELERLRPWAAAIELRKRALKSLGLTDTTIAATVLKRAWRADVVRVVTYADFNEFQRNSKGSSTVSCLEATVSGLEADRDDLQRLAKAWSMGDIDALRELVLRQKPYECLLAMYDSEQRAKDMIARHSAQWLATAQLALKSRQTSLALVPIEELFTSDGWLAALRARGYQVQEPLSAPRGAP
jgi:uncharacterized protein YbaP (TraB family)